MRREHELDRQVGQRPQALGDLLLRHMLAAAELDAQAFAEVGERIASVAVHVAVMGAK